MLTVSEIWRYPVKSMGGERLDAAEITAGGIPWDRGWAIRDERAETIRSARFIPNLLLCTARYLDGTDAGLVPHVEITLPDGATVRSDDSEVNRHLSDAIGREVTLWSLRPPEDSEHLRQAAVPEAEREQQWRDLMGLQPGDPLPDFSGIPPKLMKELTEYAAPRGTYFDAFTMNVLTTSSLRHLQGLVPDADIRAERFRPNLVVDDGGQSDHLRENDWVGSQVRAGSATLNVMMKCPRCTIASNRQAGIEKDLRITRKLVEEMQQSISVYCDVATPGEVHVGQEFRVGG